MRFKEIVSNLNWIKEFQKRTGGVSETPAITPPKERGRYHGKENFIA